MELSRRQFVILTAAAMTGCEREGGEALPSGSVSPPVTPASQPAAAAVDAGPVADFASERVYDGFREQGFFVIRRDGQVFALSSVCTHKGCKVRAQPDQSFLCKCHGSKFTPDGKVLNGPATRDLPRLAVALDERQHVLVNPAQKIENKGLKA